MRESLGAESLSETRRDAGRIDGHSRRKDGTITFRIFREPEASDYFIATGNNIGRERG